MTNVLEKKSIGDDSGQACFMVQRNLRDSWIQLHCQIIPMF